jgi:hypothetical protein
MAEGVLNVRSHFGMARTVRVSYCVVILFLLASMALPGCSSKGPPPPDAQIQVEMLAGWYEDYKVKHGNKPPPSEDALVKYIETVQKERQITQTAEDTNKLLTSPRDGQKYVVLYGKTVNPNRERNVVLYEAEGYDGKKWVGFESKWSQEVDEAELQKLLTGK